MNKGIQMLQMLQMLNLCVFLVHYTLFVVEVSIKMYKNTCKRGIYSLQ